MSCSNEEADERASSAWKNMGEPAELPHDEPGREVAGLKLSTATLLARANLAGSLPLLRAGLRSARYPGAGETIDMGREGLCPSCALEYTLAGGETAPSRLEIRGPDRGVTLALR